MSLLTEGVRQQAKAHCMVALIMLIFTVAAIAFAVLFYLDKSPWWTGAFIIAGVICGHTGILNCMKGAEVLRLARSMRCAELGIWSPPRGSN